MRESFGFLDGVSERMELEDAGDASLDMAGDAVSSPGSHYHSGGDGVGKESVLSVPVPV